MVTLEQRLKELRITNNLKQEDIVKKFSLSSPRYSQYETGKRRPDYELLVSFADFYDVSLDYLLGRTNISTMSSNMNLAFSKEEIELIKKYRALDERGKEAVDETLEREYVNSLKIGLSEHRDAVSA